MGVIDKRDWISFLNMVRIYFGAGIINVATSNFGRIILSTWMIACIVLQNSYQGSLFKFLLHPKTVPPPTTLNELLDDNYTLYMRPHAYHIFQHLPKIHKLYVIMFFYNLYLLQINHNTKLFFSI